MASRNTIWSIKSTLSYETGDVQTREEPSSAKREIDVPFLDLKPWTVHRSGSVLAWVEWRACVPAVRPGFSIVSTVGKPEMDHCFQLIQNGHTEKHANNIFIWRTRARFSRLTAVSYAVKYVFMFLFSACSTNIYLGYLASVSVKWENTDDGFHHFAFMSKLWTTGINFWPSKCSSLGLPPSINESQSPASQTMGISFWEPKYILLSHMHSLSDSSRAKTWTLRFMDEHSQCWAWICLANQKFLSGLESDPIQLRTHFSRRGWQSKKCNNNYSSVGFHWSPLYYGCQQQ